MKGKTAFILAVLLAALTAAGCVTIRSSAAPANIDSSGSPNYYPVKVGNTWTYNYVTSIGTYTSRNEIIKSSKTSFSEKASDSRKPSSYIVSDYSLRPDNTWGESTSIEYNSSGVVNNRETYSPPLSMLPSAYDIGTNEISTSVFTSSAYTYTSQVTVDISVVGFETVTVPAGTFNALKITTIVTVMNQFFPAPDIATESAWYVDGIGEIKTVSTYNTDSITNTETGVLTSYTIK